MQQIAAEVERLEHLCAAHADPLGAVGRGGKQHLGVLTARRVARQDAAGVVQRGEARRLSSHHGRVVEGREGGERAGEGADASRRHGHGRLILARADLIAVVGRARDGGLAARERACSVGDVRTSSKRGTMEGAAGCASSAAASSSAAGSASEVRAKMTARARRAVCERARERGKESEWCQLLLQGEKRRESDQAERWISRLCGAYLLKSRALRAEAVGTRLLEGAEAALDKARRGEEHDGDVGRERGGAAVQQARGSELDELGDERALLERQGARAARGDKLGERLEEQSVGAARVAGGENLPGVGQKVLDHPVRVLELVGRGLAARCLEVEVSSSASSLSACARSTLLSEIAKARSRPRCACGPSGLASSGGGWVWFRLR